MESPTGAPRSPQRSKTQPLTHRLTLADAFVIVSTLAFSGFLCVLDVEPYVALAVAVTAVSALMLVVVLPRGVVEALGLLRELVQLRSELRQEHSRNEE